MSTGGVLYELIRFSMYALAVFRVTHMLWQENGPWDIFDWLRAKAGISYEAVATFQSDEFGSIKIQPPRKFERSVPDKFFAKLLDCPWCLSLWLAVPAAAAYMSHQVVLDVCACWLAMAAVPLLLFGRKRYENAELG